MTTDIAKLPEDTDLVYANWVRMNASLLDLSIDFGYVEEPFMGPPEDGYPVRVVMSWEQAEGLIELLQDNVRSTRRMSVGSEVSTGRRRTTMATKQLLPLTELPMMRSARSDRRALKEWRDFLAPSELEAQRVVREIITSTMREIPRASPKRVPTWDQDRLIDFALNAPYPEDIEEQIEKSWHR